MLLEEYKMIRASSKSQITKYLCHLHAHVTFLATEEKFSGRVLNDAVP